MKGTVKDSAGWCVNTTSIYNDNSARVVKVIPLYETIFCVPCLRFIKEILKRVCHVWATKESIYKRLISCDKHVELDFL